MKFRQLSLFITLVFLTAQKISAQLFTTEDYPKNYFSWPVKARIAIVANFGELRPNHYHMGLDCRTDQKVNMPVVAAADGYIAKVKIEPFGFGRCIYINHPNGLTTLYAHLNDFDAPLEKYVTEQQYRLKSWAVFLDIPPGMFEVKKGAFIAWSGTTGGSQGPHTHFEIRDTKTDKVLNPLLFGMPIQDNIAPDVLRLAVYDRTKSTYEQSPAISLLKKFNGVYTVAGGKLFMPSDKVSFAITAFDKYTGSTNHNGIYEAEIFEDEKLRCGFQLDSISYDQTRYVNANIDYKTRFGGGPLLQHLSRLPGYLSSVYRSDGDDGVISLEDDSLHSIKITLKDANKNLSTIAFAIARQNGHPKSPEVSTTGQKFYPGFVNIFENNQVLVFLPENCVYDSFTFIYKALQPATGKPVYQLHNPSVPLQDYLSVRIKDNFPLADTGKVIMKRFYGSKQDFKRAMWENGWYKASFRDFGNFQLMVDNTPPVITPVGFRDHMNVTKLKRILFAVTDNTVEIRRFTALLDGSWLRFTNDKGRNFIYNFDERCPAGAHELKVTAEDQAGNITEKIYHFTK